MKVGRFGEIDLHVKDLDIGKVLQLLSIQSQRNIIATRNVSGTITADLFKVDFYEAMDAILQPNGLRFVEKGNFIYVYTIAEYEKIQQETRKAVVKVVRLNYLNAKDAATFVQPLLSTAGTIAVNGEVGEGFAASIQQGGAMSYAHAPTLVIRDYPENIEQVMAVLGQLDIKPKQVLVEATILEAKLREDNKWGVDLTVLLNYATSDFTSPASAIAELMDGTVKNANGTGSVVGSKNNLAKGDSSLSIGIVGNDVSAFIDALDRVTDTTILANPKLLVLNRQKANLLVGERKGYVSTTQTDTASTQTIEFLETGTQLSVRPFISEDNIVRMEIKPSISTGEVAQIAEFVVPNEQTEEVTTNVMVASGQTVVLGGLFKEETTITRQQVPYLGDIPLAGNAFKGKSDVVTRNEFIFLITPTVMKETQLATQAARVMDSAELARIGSREGLLPWSRTKLTASHLRQAMKYKDEGKAKKAMWSVNRALTLDPTFQEAHRLREELNGSRPNWPNQSILRDAADRVIADHEKSAAPAQPAAEAPAAPQAPTAADASSQTEHAPVTEKVEAPVVTTVSDSAPAAAPKPAEDKPADAAPVAKEAPAQETPAQDKPADAAPAAKEAPAQETPAEEKPAEQPAAQGETPAESPAAPQAETPAEPAAGEGESAVVPASSEGSGNAESDETAEVES